MRKIIGRLLLATALLATSASAFSKRNAEKEVYLPGSDGKKYGVVFATGKDGGTWDKGADSLKNKVGIDRKTQNYGVRIENVNGTDDIVYHIGAKEANAGFIQGDKIPALLADKEFSKGKAFIKLGDKSIEYVQLIMREGMDEDDLQGKIKGHTPVVFAGPEGSGGRISAYNIKSLEDSYVFSVVEGEEAESYDYDVTALSALKAGEIDAIIKTSKPIPGKDAFGNLVGQMKGIELVDFDDSDLNDTIKLPNGKEEAIYEFNEFSYTGSFFSSDTESPSVHTYIVIDKANMSKSAYKKLLSAIVKAKYNPFNN